jgi:hypothetical protein
MAKAFVVLANSVRIISELGSTRIELVSVYKRLNYLKRYPYS